MILTLLDTFILFHIHKKACRNWIIFIFHFFYVMYITWLGWLNYVQSQYREAASQLRKKLSHFFISEILAAFYYVSFYYGSSCCRTWRSWFCGVCQRLVVKTSLHFIFTRSEDEFKRKCHGHQYRSRCLPSAQFLSNSSVQYIARHFQDACEIRFEKARISYIASRSGIATNVGNTAGSHWFQMTAPGRYVCSG